MFAIILNNIISFCHKILLVCFFFSFLAFTYNKKILNYTSSFEISSWAVGVDTIIRRAMGVMKPSSTALSMKDNNES